MTKAQVEKILDAIAPGHARTWYDPSAGQGGAMKNETMIMVSSEKIWTKSYKIRSYAIRHEFPIASPTCLEDVRREIGT